MKVISIRGLWPIIFKLHSNDFDGEFGACELWLGAAAASDHSSDRKNVRPVRKEWDFFPPARWCVWASVIKFIAFYVEGVWKKKIKL